MWLKRLFFAMHPLQEIFEKNDWIFYVIIGLLLFPALLINIGVLPFIDDESIRALVSMEMIFSGDYITPTIAGELYFRKPPVFNWLVVLFYKISGNFSDTTLRCVSVFSLLMFGLIIYKFVKGELGKKNAIMVSLMLITCGRILIYDSYYGLIDIAYSALVYMSIMLIWHLFKKKNLLILFLVSYALTAVTFLMKGLPSIYYQGVSLLVIFISEKKFKKLFSWKHLSGIFLFVGIIGLYYALYLVRNPGNLRNVFQVLFTESSEKTALGFSIADTVKYIFTFPFRFIYHFLPWTLWVIYFIRKDIRQVIFNHPFIRINLYLFIFNILIYWFSPNTFARYLFVHAPMMFVILVYLHQIHKEENTLHFRLQQVIFLFLGGILILIPFFYPILNITKDVPHAILKAIVVILSSALFFMFLFRLKNQRFLIIVIILLIGRIGFDWFIIPSREKTNFLSQCRDEAIAVGKATSGYDLHLVRGTLMSNHALYYISRERKEQLKWTDDISDPDAYYIIQESTFKGPEYDKYFEFHLRYQRTIVSVVKFKF
jgi:4-amino-4-deoxy-L-arabinose transferase-like glycosyltransferase